LTTLAKILAGGFPGGALAGRKEVMDALDFAVCGASGGEKIAHHGTFNANPVSAAAGIAALEFVGSTDACERANGYARQLRNGMNAVLREEGVNWTVYGTFSSFHIFTNPLNIDVSPDLIEAGKLDYHALKAGRRNELIMKLRLAIMLHGAEVFVWPGGPTSAAHSSDDLDKTCTAFRGALRLLREDGELG
jgi:glutamate-1-semialdehyde 2,1-aminomutase